MFLLLPVLVLAAPAEAQPDEAARTPSVQKARAAAVSWLALVDDGEFEESWEAAAPPFRQRVDRDEWEREGRRLRNAVPAPSRRTLTTARPRDSLRRAPEGPFAVLTYRSATETGTVEESLLMTRTDATWGVAGYRVTRPAPRTRSALDSVSSVRTRRPDPR